MNTVLYLQYIVVCIVEQKPKTIKFFKLWTLQQYQAAIIRFHNPD